MAKPIFVDKNRTLHKSTDFHFLRKEGIKRIQELTGTYWTDFNIHDPGVTILEQLCYAITDLGYRTSIDIEKHIFNKPNEKAPFFKPEEILTIKPITIQDYRKVFIDTIPEIKNIWITPLTVNECAFNGLYNVYVDITNQGLIKGKEALSNEIKRLFNNFRSIGEDIFEINILEELPLIINANIETDGIHELEKVLAQTFYCIENSLAPEVKFHSLQELIDKGLSYEQIFDGPFLKNGFILTSELTNKNKSISISDIIREVMQIEGVTSVKHLSVEINGQKYTSHITIPDNMIPRVITDELTSSHSNGTDQIKFFKGSLEYTGINKTAFIRYLNELVSENKKNYRISESSFNIPKVIEPINFHEYYSIQNHFPAIYGIGKEGIPGRPDEKRKAKAKQLKAYLILFEQVMANYLSQLSHFTELLSIHKKQEQTYFSQYLSTIPNSGELFRNTQDYLNDVYLNLNNIPANYYEGLPKLNSLFDNYVDRRNRFLDYLLSLHGETYTQNSLQQFNPYYSDEEFAEFLIMCKTALLQNLGIINYNKAKGVNIYNNETYPPLIQRIGISLGFGISEDNGKISIKMPDSFFEPFTQRELNLETENAKKHYKNWIIESETQSLNLTKEIIASFDPVDDIDLDQIDLNNINRTEWIKNLLPFKSKKITKQFLFSGIDIKNYKIGKTEDNKFILLYFAKELKDWISFNTYTSEYEALIALKILIDEIKTLNITTEGVKMIEHILLRPTPDQKMFGIYINDNTGKHLLKSNKQYSLNERKDVIQKLSTHFTNSELFSVEADSNREMNILFKITELDLEFKSIQPNISVEETHLQKENLINFLANDIEETKKVSKFGFYIQYNVNSIDIPEEFFSFQISLIFPNWSARFQNSEFREIAHDIITEQKPSNISANIGWLKIAEIKKFENLETNFNESLNKEITDSDRFISASELAEFLYIKNYS